ncbi:MAG: 50S ribosomal protein L10 [Candidatus Bathyarchaeota archaeon]|uniref:50S ribosomal protein L10 n=1 Tax=Candidatus Bathycorpusculum sp. TaxID=2994959 RepID=UPI0028257BEC|nr:50S ribosomal protein L10 [Candidatus Termiticorpusculum sp.]MCL2258008.1 50S ribosomal protein L10 [Candidatus Termiticorpusculum sp.]MCL2291622.1 50S ribosomal protein L10 [Candidatus Termiticorpusculum sp.]
MPSQQVLQQKTSEVEEIVDVLKDCKSIGIASLQKVRASQLQELKKSMKGQVTFRVLKNTLVKLALEEMKKAELVPLEDYLEGPNVFMFTELNPFKLALLLEKGKVKTFAKSGDIAATDVVIPVSNTGQPPGPVISQLNAVGLPTRIENGSVWVSKDTLVVRRGEPINERLASVLSKLGIKSVELGISMRAVYDNGLIITGNQLIVDVPATRRSVEINNQEALALALEISYTSKDTIKPLLQRAHQKAVALSVGAAVPTKETIGDIIRKANAEMSSLSSAVEKVTPKA